MAKGGNVGRPPKEGSTLSKEKVLKLALRMIDEGGDKAASFRALARKLDVTPMAVSHHVGSRKEMLASLIARVFHGVGSDAEGDTPSDRLRFLLVRYCARVLKHPNLIRCVLADPTLIDDQLVSLTALIRSNAKMLIGDDKDDALLNLIIDYTHGFAFSALTAPSDHPQTTQDYLRSLEWVLDRAEQRLT